jgi:AraC-like DNA-binding protein
LSHPKTFPVEAGWRTLFKDLGLRPIDVLRRAGLREDLFSRPEPGLNTAEYFRLWDSLVSGAADPLFPLRLVDAMTTETFSPPLFASLCSPNLAVAMQRISRYKRLVAPMALDVAEGHDLLVVEPRWLESATAVPSTLIATELAFLLRLARLATREPIRAVEVVVPSPPQPLAAYSDFFGVELRAGDAPRIVFSAADAQRPFLTANESLWEMFEPNLRRRLGELDRSADIGERVRAILLEALPGGLATMQAVAARLAMSKRTLQRRLSEDGTTFQAVVNRTRADLAHHYLTRTTLACSEISFLLGFENPSSFFRAFHDWTGRTPESLRQEPMH